MIFNQVQSGIPVVNNRLFISIFFVRYIEIARETIKYVFITKHIKYTTHRNNTNMYIHVVGLI